MTAATTGLGIRRMLVIIGWYRSVSTRYTSIGPFSACSAASRSAPVEKARPAPVMTTARIAAVVAHFPERR